MKTELLRLQEDMNKAVFLFFVLHSLKIAGVLCSCPSTVNPDVRGWGSNCAYRCNCLNNVQCDEEIGECPNGCETGWMGPACQYQNIVFGNKTKDVYQFPASNIPEDYAVRAVDGDMSTCSRTGFNTSVQRKFWNVEFYTHTYFVGLVLKIKAADTRNFRGFSVEVANNTENMETCYTHKEDEDGSPYMDISCVQPTVGKILRISFAYQQTSDMVLCEVEVYGGRLVSFRKQTSIKSVLEYKGEWFSYYAVDGRGPKREEDQDNSTTRTCAATVLNTPSHKWLLVDLSATYSIQAVHFYGRWEVPNQFQNFVIRDGDTNETIFSDGSLNLSALYYHPKSHDLIWPINSRTVRVDRTQAILVVCELEIFAECPYGKCGWNCDQTCFCRSQAAGTHKIMGQCPYGCVGRWTGEKLSCVKECKNQEWGPQCNKTCGHCEHNSLCSVTNGSCPGSCKPGWKPPACADVCDEGTFGTDCLETCGNCVNGDSCNTVNGECFNGCADGYNGQNCNRFCVPGSFGRNCSDLCGYCLNGEVCHHVDGNCPQGCAAGFSGKYCKECSYGLYGVSCKEVCGHCKDDASCNKTTGNCESCKPGYQMTLCKTPCAYGWYGENCQLRCGMCEGHTPCNATTGVCAHGCLTGYYGSLCQETSLDSSDRSGLIIGMAVVNVALVISLVFNGILYYKWHSKSRVKKENTYSKPIVTGPEENAYDVIKTSPDSANQETSLYYVNI